MLKLAVVFLVISLVAGALGFTGVARGAGRIARILFVIAFVIFLILVAAAFLLGQALF